MRHTLKMRNNDGQTPLHIAVMVGTKEIVRALVEAGAKVDTKDKVKGCINAFLRTLSLGWSCCT